MIISLPEEYIVPIVYKDSFKFTEDYFLPSKEEIYECKEDKNYWKDIDKEYVNEALKDRPLKKHKKNCCSKRNAVFTSEDIFEEIDEEYYNHKSSK
ncbi:hypothetical protein [Clostridium polynesiense]|uniref:hypothetical protein n=1 Tax=Clostridium polynesiense TaxID=1325933 RepID=UPI00058E0E0E|nr:hypothetical protein [Clostridium polynesiense]